MLINVKMLIAGKMTGYGDLNLKIPSILDTSIFMNILNFMLS